MIQYSCLASVKEYLLGRAVKASIECKKYDFIASMWCRKKKKEIGKGSGEAIKESASERTCFLWKMKKTCNGCKDRCPSTKPYFSE